MEQTIERCRTFHEGHNLTNKDVLEVLNPKLPFLGTEETLYVLECSCNIFTDVFWCGRNEILYDLVTGVLGEDDEPSLFYGANEGERREFDRDCLQKFYDISVKLLNKMQTMDPEDEDYPQYDIDHLTWLITELKDELDLNLNNKIYYSYSCTY